MDINGKSKKHVWSKGSNNFKNYPKRAERQEQNQFTVAYNLEQNRIRILEMPKRRHTKKRIKGPEGYGNRISLIIRSRSLMRQNNKSAKEFITE